MILSENLKKYRKTAGYPVRVVSEKTGIPYRTYQNYEYGRSTPPADNLRALAELYGVSMDELLGDGASDPKPLPAGAEPFTEKLVKIPFFGDVSAGLGAYAGGEPPESFEVFPASDILSSCEYLSLRVRGDSMVPELKSGDIVLVRRQSIVDSGDIGVAIVDGNRGLVKRIYIQQNRITLVSVNENYSPENYVGEDANRVKILGKVVSMKRGY